MVSPNPGNESINVKSTIVLPATIIFTDVLGREVVIQTVKTTNQTIGVSQLDKGIYMYRVTNSKNENSSGKRIKS